MVDHLGETHFPVNPTRTSFGCDGIETRKRDKQNTLARCAARRETNQPDQQGAHDVGHLDDPAGYACGPTLSKTCAKTGHDDFAECLRVRSERTERGRTVEASICVPSKLYSLVRCDTHVVDCVAV
jgi:hypothetical protein